MGDVSEHAVRAPSGAYQWRRCAGSITAQKPYQDSVGVEAAEGTLFHAHGELALLFGLDPHHFKTGLKQEVDGHIVEYNDEMIESMYAGLDWIREQWRPDCLVFTEVRVPIERWTLEEGAEGTCDICVLFPRERRIIVADWKYGKVAVVALKNDQMILYGLGIWEKFGKRYFGGDPKNVVVDIRVLQPRVPLGGSSWTTTMKTLLKEGESIKIDAKATYEKNAPRTAGLKQCRYCKARAECPALAEFNLSLVKLKFEDIDEGYEWGFPPALQKPECLTPERRSYVLLHKAVFVRWLEELHRAALRDFAGGKQIPQMKVVEGKSGKRKFIDEPVVKKMLVDDLGPVQAYKKTLISPAQAEKKIGKRAFAVRYKPFVEQAPPKPSLVPDTDERPALPSKAMLFDLLEEGDSDE